MSVKQFTVDLQNITQQEFLRFSVGYRYFFDIQKAEVFRSKNNIKLKHILKEIKTKKVSKGELNDSETLIDLCNIERRFNNLINIEEVDQVGSDKNIIQSGDIVIPKLQPQMGNIFLNLEHKRYIGSTELLEYSITDNYNPLFIYYLFTTNRFLSDLGKLESGKTHRRVNPTDLFNIKIPLVPKPTQDQIVAQIEPIEQKIKDLKKTIKEPYEIINKVFAREFGFDLEKFEELKKIKNYYLNFSSFANNKDLRQSVKFHREAGRFVVKELEKITNKKIKNFISEPIVLGKGISPSNYDDNGDYFYISMADIKNWKFESEDSRLVSKEYSDKNKNKTVLKGDILIARSGEGTIGKVALIDDTDLQGIFADFIMRIRLKSYNCLFAYYYFRTDYFQYLIEINKKGLGNNTNIFPSQIEEFPMIDIDLQTQQKIVDEIKAELDKQEEIKQKIEEERNKVDEIIVAAIS
jgi:restriction endonuclease S subunit